MKIKRFVLGILTVCMAAFFALGIVACGGAAGGGKIPSITLSATEKKMDIYETFTLKATTENLNGVTVEWSSSDAAVASVDQNGLVKAKTEGIATITASAGEVSAICSVTVENSHSIPVCTLSSEDVEILQPNGELTVSAFTTYNGHSVDGLSYTWSVDKDGIVELNPSQDTTSVTVKGLGFGTVNVRCVTVCNGVPLTPSFTVNVFNSNVAFEVSGLTEGVNGYPVSLTLFDDETYDNQCAPTVTVMDGTQAVDGSQIVWSSEDESIATVENGVIKAKALGTTKVLAFYNNNGVYFDVTVAYAQFDVTDFAYLQVGRDNGLDRNEAVQGEISSVLYNGFELFKNEEDGIIHLNEKAVEKIGLGKVAEPIVVYTDMASYSYKNVEFIALEINSKEDFDRMDEVALSLGDGDTSMPTMDGIFYLNVDIQYNGVYTPNILNVANDSTGGFRGTFDGRGHVISGLKIQDDGYIFGGIMGTAAFKNVTFLNAEYDGTNLTSGTGAFLSKVVDGELENVFIHLAKVTLKNCNAMLIAQANHGGAKAFKNVIVAIDQIVKAAGATRKPVLQTIGSRCWSVPYENVIGIAPTVEGVDVSMITTCENDGKGNAINWMTYRNNYTALTAMTENFENGGWDKDFWHAIGGVVLPKTVSLLSKQMEEMGNNAAGIAAWKAYKKNVEGVDKSTYKNDYQFVGNLVIDLSGDNFESVLSATINGVEYASYYNNGTLTIPKTALTTRGDCTLLIVATKNDNGELKTVSVIKPLLLADIFISTADDFEAMQWLADPYAEDTVSANGIMVMKAAGYIVLTNDIAYNRTYKVHERAHSWGDGPNKGFAGTLDGQGYTVDGLEMVEQVYAQNNYSYAGFCSGAFSNGATWTAGSGLFASLCGNASIKNIAFTNAKHSCGGGFITTLAWNGDNVIENVYIHLTYARGTDAAPVDRYGAAGVFQARMHGGSFVVQNCVVVIDKVETGKYYYDFGAFTQHPSNFVAPTRSNVFIISSNEELVASITEGAPSFATTLTGVIKYANAAAATADKDAWLVLPDKYWDTTGELPTFQ